MSSPILSLHHYGLLLNGRRLLHPTNLEIADRGITVLMGPSGTGKSTLLRTLAGLNEHHPTLTLEGQAFYRGQRLAATSERPALVIQKAASLMAPVLECLASGLPNRSELTRLQQVAQITAHCEALGQPWVTEQLATPMVQLAFPQQRTLAILRETLSSPPLLMLDEPTVGMDDAAVSCLNALIRRVAADCSVVLVTHNLAQTRALADWVILMASGRVQESASVKDFFDHPVSESAQCFLRTGSCPEQSMTEPESVAPEPMLLESPPLQPLPVHKAVPSPPPADDPVAMPAGPGATVQDVRPVPQPIGHSPYRGPQGFVWLIPGRLAGTPWPGIVRDTDEDLACLRDVGITRLLSLTEVPFPAETAARYGIGVDHCPIPDMKAPSLVVAAQCCEALEQALADGESVAVHCKAGLGRTGTLLAAYWLWCHPGCVTAPQAIARIRQLEHRMIQSEDQIDFIEEFHKYRALMETSGA